MSDVTFDRQGWSFECDPSLPPTRPNVEID